jgi:sulfur-oxidizing protein SoxY
MGKRGKAKPRAGAGLPSTRREVMRFAGSLGLGSLLPSLLVRPAAATPASLKAAMAMVIGDAKLKVGRVKLEIPPLVENGNTVACAVAVESPMTETDYVKAIHVFNEKNPQPNVISVKLGPRAGRAAIATRIRLSDSQTVTAVAQMSDGSFWSTSVDVLITLGACLEDPL